MSSQAQIDADRRNAKKSTGPVSLEGKAACSLNALKSGIYAFSHVIPGEDPAEFEALAAAYFHQHQPADPARRIEAELWALQCDSLYQNLTRAEFTDASFQHKSPLAPLNALEAFSRLQRRIESTNRMYLRTLKALQGLQKAPPEDAGEHPTRPPDSGCPPACDKSEPPQNPQPLKPPIGFVPSFTPEPAARPRECHENHESSLQTERPTQAEHAPTGTPINQERSSRRNPPFRRDPTCSRTD